MRRDQRSPEAQAYRHLYKTYRWQQIRARQLAKQPLCQPCLRNGYVTKATVCHHLDPKTKATPEGFYAGPFESVCATCHDSDIQSQEKGGKPKVKTGLDGWPVL
jgi:5-methylcytosine-specific restriction enzyme A